MLILSPQHWDLFLRGAVAGLLLAGCVSSAAWLWAAARALFDDGFAFVGWVADVLAATP
ncbi:MAG: hypothetical protein IPP87_15110 [Ideonella sp.]|nr:hypothetical protein [Ideonella sp.]